MGVQIEQIWVKGQGPIVDFNMNLGSVNLIYGRNEQGKTHLVEVLIRALFKKPGFEFLRPLTGQGEVLVSGIDAKPLKFSTQGRSKKLEDRLNNGDGRLPTSVARLLVVRAGELEMAKNATGGVSRAILKEYLSNEGFLDAVQGRISKTIQSAQFDSDFKIIGNNTGEIKEREAQRARLKDLDDLFERMKNVYSGGQRAELERRLEETRGELEKMESARKHLAWKLDQELQRLEREKAKLPKEDLEELKQNLFLYDQKINALSEQEKQREEKEAACVNYPWLEEAITVYNRLTLQPAESMRPALLIIAGIALLSAVIFSFLNLPILTGLLIILATVLGWFHLRKMQVLGVHSAASQERADLLAEFTRRFGVPSNGLAGFEEMKKRLQPEMVAVNLLREQIETVTRELQTLRLAIHSALEQFVGHTVEESAWGDTYNSLKKNLIDLKDQIRQAQQQLDRLNVDPLAYLVDDPQINYNSEDHRRLQEQAEQLQHELEVETADLNNLKAEIGRVTRMELSTPWEELIGKLKEMRADLGNDYRALTARMAAGILVNSALVSFRQQEDQHIQTGLKSPLVCEPLKAFTRHYDQLDLEGEHIIVCESLASYPLAELSTGAQEQVLLALRIGFARKLFGQDTAFLIMDDAFQHSDWKRRESLVDAVVDLAIQGWQILYFTMDDHIRDLFEQRVGPILKEKYCYKELCSAITL